MQANQQSLTYRLLDLSDEFLAMSLTLRDGSGLGPMAEVRERLTACLTRLENRGLDAGLQRETLAALKYPLVALADDIILNSNWENLEAWRDQPLQLALFNERMAGSGFFTRLEQYRQDPANNRELLEVYHVALSLGFRGKFRISGQDQLQRLVVDLRQQLGYGQDVDNSKLSPHGKQRDGYAVSSAAGFPFWKLAAITGGVLVILFVIFFFWINHSASQAIELLPKPEF